MRYAAPVVGIVVFLCFFAGVLARAERSWQRTAQLILGVLGMATCGLFLLRRLSNHNGVLLGLTAVVVGGIAVGVFITLFVEGTLNPASRKPQ
jgi:hypothetical protein